MTDTPTTTVPAAVTVLRPVPGAFSAEHIDLIKRTVCRGASDDELELFLHQARRTGLDPLARQIYAVRRYDRQQGREVMQIQTSIDGFRLIAERTGKYQGQLGPYWCGPDGEWHDVWISEKPPAAACIGVLRADFAEPLWAPARTSAYAQRTRDGRPTPVWLSMCDVMIAKCAEALALRRAFPQELAGLYTGDEMEQAGVAVDEPAPVRANPAPRQRPPTERESPRARLERQLRDSVESERDWNRHERAKGGTPPATKVWAADRVEYDIHLANRERERRWPNEDRNEDEIARRRAEREAEMAPFTASRGPEPPPHDADDIPAFLDRRSNPRSTR